MAQIEEIMGSPTWRVSAQGNGSIRRFKVDEDLVDDFVDLLTGTSTGYPAEHPFLSFIRVNDIAVDPWEDVAPKQGKQGTGGRGFESATDAVQHYARYKQYLITVSYGGNFHDPLWNNGLSKPLHRAGTVLKFRGRGSAQFLTYPARAFKWQDQNASSSGTSGETIRMPQPARDMNNRILIPVLDFSVEWLGVQSYDMAALELKIGHVNQSAAFGGVIAAECLLLESIDFDEDYRMSRDDPFCLKAIFNYRVRMIRVDAYTIPGRVIGGVIIPPRYVPASWMGWNHEFRDNPPGWVKVFMADGRLRYPMTDALDDLFL